MRLLRLMAVFLAFGLALAAPVTYQVTGSIVYQARGPMGTFKGENTQVTGHVVWDDKAQTVSGEVCVDLSAWDSGEPLRDKHTRTMFEVDRFPKACFKITGIQGDVRSGQVTLLGELSIHGVTRPAQIPGTVQISGGRIVFDGSFETKITDWDMRRPSLLGFKVRDLVKVRVHGEGVAR